MLIPNKIEGVSLLEPGALIPTTLEDRLYEPLRRLVGTKAASLVLARVGGEGVGRMNASDLAASAAIRPELAERIVASRELTIASAESPRSVAATPEDVVAALPSWLRTAEVEIVLALALDGRHAVKGILLVAKGGATRASFQPRDVMTPLVRISAAGFILVHNHPTFASPPIPSEADIEMTNRLAVAGEQLGIQLVDHLVISGKETASFFELGLLPDAEDLETLAAASAEERRTKRGKRRAS
jgi:DNA repair protein RadC